MSKRKNKGVASKKTHTSLSKFRFSHSFVIVALAFATLLASANIQVAQNLTSTNQNVLGEDEKNEEQKEEEQKKEGEQKKEERSNEEEKKREEVKKTEEVQRETIKKRVENRREAAKITTTGNTERVESSRRSIKSKTETISQTGLKMQTQSEGNKKETEIETADGQKIKTKIEDDGTTKIEIENGSVKLKYRVENGQTVLKAENESGEEVEIEDDELEKLEKDVEDELEDDGVKLVQTSGDKLALTQNQTAAVTNFPLSINTETKEFIITTPAGQKVVTMLPDEAVKNLLATGIINKIETPPSDITTQDKLGEMTGVVSLETRNNEVVYKVKGTKTHKMLGVIPVTTPVTAFVSADTGITVAKQQSILSNVVDFLSP